ncbi:MAG: isoprenylcysteine carboxylmethyltransferase family protein [Rhodovibrionaceae bacterium]
MREQQRDAATRFFPPAVPLATVLIGAGLEFLWPLDPGFALAAPARYWLGGAIVAGAILALGAWPVLLFRRSGQSPKPWEPTPEILVRGPYRFTRNPMYLQMVLVCLGFAVLLWNLWILLLTPLCGWLLQIYAIAPEEAYLERTFGAPYLAYKRRVRRWI